MEVNINKTILEIFNCAVELTHKTYDGYHGKPDIKRIKELSQKINVLGEKLPE